ncbi:hypothetical protein Ahy_B07g088322 isoform C [Arachis hypogaea]|uniref:Uncharacterized protein n=1 Tax=Arachis hypogaea TaxID=3818 RepID=A0A444YE77_ARAHY|nr:hypothetical protein Ahy_B07g088322 isoform C [Arachis hypogaea]
MILELEFMRRKNWYSKFLLTRTKFANILSSSAKLVFKCTNIRLWESTKVRLIIVYFIRRLLDMLEDSLTPLLSDIPSYNQNQPNSMKAYSLKSSL